MNFFDLQVTYYRWAKELKKNPRRLKIYQGFFFSTGFHRSLYIKKYKWFSYLEFTRLNVKVLYALSLCFNCTVPWYTVGNIGGKKTKYIINNRIFKILKTIRKNNLLYVNYFKSLNIYIFDPFFACEKSVCHFIVGRALHTL